MGIQHIRVEKVNAFRLERQHLNQRLALDAFLQAADLAVPNTPPGGAAVSLWARVSGLAQSDVVQALEVDKSLSQTWTMRGAPHVFPTAEMPVFTRGLMPEDDGEWIDFIPGVQACLVRTGLAIRDALNLTKEAILDVLDGRTVYSKKTLDRDLADWIFANLDGEAKATWDEPSGFGRGQRLGEALVSFCLRPAALEGLVCFAGRRAGETCFARMDQWLGKSLSTEDAAGCQRSLVLKYLGLYGPTTAAEFGGWAGVGKRQAERLWRQAEGMLAEVVVDERRRWMLEEDIPALDLAQEPEGIRLLPAHDPFLQTRDHASLVPERWKQKEIWKTASSPGIVTAGGRIAGTWRSRITGKRLEISARLFLPLDANQQTSLEEEAESLAAFLGCQNWTLNSENDHQPGL